MRRIIALLLTVVMALSLVVVAGAADDVPGTVNLEVTTKEGAEPVNGVTTELVYYVYLKPQKNAEVGAAQFTLTAPKGASFEDVDINENYVYKPSGTAGFGKETGIFAIGAITDTAGNVGGRIENGGAAFKAILAGTVRETTTNKENVTFEKRMLTSSNCEEWLYKLTVTLNTPYDENNSYVVGIDKSSLKAGYNRNVNEPTTTTDITLQHAFKTSSDGYGKVAYEIEAVGKNANTPQFTVDGTDLTVTYKLACVAAYKLDDAETYSFANMTGHSTDSYTFDLSSVPTGAKVIVVVKGDLNGDGEIKNFDATTLRKAIASKIVLTPEQMIAADINRDGKIRNYDASQIRKFIASRLDSLL